MNMRKTMVLLDEICLKYHKDKLDSFKKLQEYEFKIHSKNLDTARYTTTYYYMALSHLIGEYKNVLCC